MKELEIQASLQILKTREEVFEAIVDPSKMAHYFIEEGSSRMEDGKTIQWKFPEFEDRFSIEVQETKKPEFISFNWEGAKDKTLKVQMILEDNKGKTIVKITEGKMENDEEGILWYGRNTFGWANFLACLKAYLEYGINLRKGSFDFMKKTDNPD
ncbi:ATPase [Christiangramia fulva]|uniref:ATPase n=1 Tax=Christiangramia fulva TaxID=2126553 RepID=A0A2R3Z2L4_9FLAO|nr:SRPBCC domain-containing protein [Christiangramia fulva]AVR44488.1 ATPase [Christiangramia fulva]